MRAKLSGLCLLVGTFVVAPVVADPVADARLAAALADLSAKRREIAEGKIPLATRMLELQARALTLREEARRYSRLGDNAGVELAALEQDVKLRNDEIDYLESLLLEYLTQLPARAHPAEYQLHGAKWDALTARLDAADTTVEARFEALVEGLREGFARTERLLGGDHFEGRAIGPRGEQAGGRFLLFGPAAYFVSGDGAVAGLATQGASGQPAVLPFRGAATLREVAPGTPGLLPVDTTLGRAIALESTDETLVEHIRKGGIWIYPILFSALVSLAVGVYKTMEMSGIRMVGPEQVPKLVRLVRAGDLPEARREAQKIGGPAGDLLQAAVEAAHEPKELLEEICLEKILETQPRVNRLLSVISITAAAAPLLGLLGTVTGMINTFKLITIFGTGDARQLSSGISEALITTEFGLIVAIPALILHAFLAQRARSIVARMETMAIGFINGVSAARPPAGEEA